MLWVLAAGLALVALGLGIKVALLRHGMKALRQDLVERRGQDTNTLLSLPCRDRELRRLASALNQELRALRQERLRYQQGDKELKEAVVNISHDLRTPLTAISGYLQLLQGQDLPPDTRRYLEQIGGRAQAMKRLTEELFRYSVVVSEETLAREPVDLRRAVEEAGADLRQPTPMNRLLQGDVGSGKTVVAAACAWFAWENGCQTALMAPTELLAQQHAKTLEGLLAGSGLVVDLLTGSMTAAQKRACRERLAAGETHLLVGTHALLSEGVDFPRLGLVITDEQHRFGVGQRAALAAKGGQGLHPHVLVMSATPIPRTLALMIYGDLDLSVLDELPPGRTPVATYLVHGDKRQRLFAFARKQVAQGRQVYVVCPAVDQEDPEGMKAAQQYGHWLQTQVFPDLRVAIVHGRQKPKDKQETMAAFAAGQVDILVSTTVIEVGVDVPNANLMIIEDADRFGLSQLHQLRGRVGRGQWQSYCVLLSDSRSETTRQRLRALTATNDGFVIAEEDLKLRGPGDFFGARQHGLPQLKLASLEGDMRLLHQAQAAARALLAQDPDLAGHPALRQRVEELFQAQGDGFN